ncbi:HlyC/CorC family transporter [Ornithinimicrobium ciconiae]|uniref:HlyC/CorC family transporter n=1 Tax=Ornithinimicrobium ciconiae TaxID=2594265 RepID=A0A516GCY4_9MICO|nr:hemolysin family protein [Ornithinimicrobium ciconiae]QDO89389.1 HlyC/CorC family transporter [Ornithinimicrobium ciconiae]
MDSQTLVNLGLVLVFVLIGGVFAGTEMAIVTLRDSQVRKIEASGARGERIGELVRNPNQFLSAVQIGVTVAGFFSSAYGGSTIAPDLVPILLGWGVPDGIADTVALIVMTLLIAYLSLVFGELVPKRLAMQRSATFTRLLAPPLGVFAKIVRPVIWLLSVSTNFVVRLLGGDPHAKSEEMSTEEVREIIEGHQGLRPYSRAILTDVFRAHERNLDRVMRPRPDVQFLEGDATVAEVRSAVVDSAHSRFPVTGRSVDDILGFVHIRDILGIPMEEWSTRIADLTRPIVPLPGSIHVLPAMSRLRDEKQQIALVVDEYGGTDGIVTMEDLIEEVVGEIYDEYDAGTDPEDATLRRGESLDVDGSLNIEEFEDLTGVESSSENYDTVGGLVLERLGRLAETGDTVEHEGLRIEVLALDGMRIERVRVTSIGPGKPAE